jgi:predicted DNA-binding ribbon-helix-helix protein
MLNRHNRLRVNVIINDRRTSISIEPEAWQALTEIARRREMSIDELVGRIDAVRGTISRASAIRLYILDFYRKIARGAKGARLNPTW